MEEKMIVVPQENVQTSEIKFATLESTDMLDSVDPTGAQLDDLPPRTQRRFTFGHADKVTSQSREEQQQKRNSLPGKLMREMEANAASTDWNFIKDQAPQSSPRFLFRRVHKRSDSASSSDSTKSSKSNECHHHGSAGVLHSLSHKIHDKAKKLFDKIKLGLEQECEVLETIVTTEEVHQVDFDHAREIIDTFLEHGQVTATAEPEEGDQDLVMHALPVVSAESCVPEVHSAPDNLEYLENTQSDRVVDADSSELVSYAEPVSQFIGGCSLFSEFTNTSATHQMKEIADGVPDYN